MGGTYLLVVFEEIAIFVTELPTAEAVGGRGKRVSPPDIMIFE